MNKIKCKKCGWEWSTKSVHYRISCPSCGDKNINKDMSLVKIKPKINFTIDGKILESRKLEGFEMGEVTGIKKRLSKKFEVPEVEIMTEVED